MPRIALALALALAACGDCDARTDRYDLCVMGRSADRAAISLDLAVDAALGSRKWRRPRRDLGAIVRASGVTVELRPSWVVVGAAPCASEADLCLGLQARGVIYLTWDDGAACAGDTYAAHEALHLLLWLDEHPSYGAAHDEQGVWCHSNRDLDCAERRAIDALEGACAVLGGVLNP